MHQEKILKARLAPKTTLKIPKSHCSSQELQAYFELSFDLYDRLFGCISDEKYFYVKPEPLRHPLIFYYGHTASFYANKLFEQGLISRRINQKLETMLAVGVDEMSWDDFDEAHYEWPSVQEVKEFKLEVRTAVLAVIDRISTQISWSSDAWVVLMGIQHEKIHFQTSSTIIRRLPIEATIPFEDLFDCPHFSDKTTPKNQLKPVPAVRIDWDKQILTTEVYGWDNQFGKKTFDVKDFKMSKMLVSNGEFLEFVNDRGYEKLQLWDEEGKKWLRDTKPIMPVYWLKHQNDEGYQLRTMNRLMNLPLDWPVEVNNLQATAFCNWKGLQTGKSLRLPTEDEYFALRNLLKLDHHEWAHGQVGNLNMQYWFSPSPVDMFRLGQFYDIVGNVWQMTKTPIYMFQQSEFHPRYDDYSSPTCDGRHYLLFGGCFASTGNFAVRHTRNAFRRHFHQFSGFRYVQVAQEAQSRQEKLVTDQILKQIVAFNFFQESTFIHRVLEILKSLRDQNTQGNSLVVGCSGGRMVLQLSGIFKKSYGIDYTVRKFQLASTLVREKKVTFEGKEMRIECFCPKPEGVAFLQMNPEIPDPRKINQLAAIVIDEFQVKSGTTAKIVAKMIPLMKSQCLLLLIKDASAQLDSTFEALHGLNMKSKKCHHEQVKLSSQSQNKVLLQLHKLWPSSPLSV